MVALLLLLLIFGFIATICGVGVWAAWSMGDVLHDAYRTQSWVAASATVVRVSLEVPPGGDDDSDDVVKALYRYEFGGRVYTGTRLGLPGSVAGDSFDGWHTRTHAKLEQAHENRTPVTVWVNPGDPEEAVFDPSLRVADIVFTLPMALLFGGMGFGTVLKVTKVMAMGRQLQAELRQRQGKG
jgi:hypothetical protein